MRLFSGISRWMERRRALAKMCKEDVRELLERNPAAAYYDAQRLAARARVSGDTQSFMHWARVAAEIARTSDNPMDLNIVRTIVDEEERRAGEK